MTDTETPPFTRNFDLGRLPGAGADLRLDAKGEELTRIAQWADVCAVEAFGATIRLRKHSANRFALDAELVADIVQNCVVTLEPVTTHIARAVHRELHIAERTRLKPHELIPLGAGAGDDEVPEEIDGTTYDLAAPLLEELVLAIDPYIRAPGVEFVEPAPEAPEPARPNPFAVLKSLKDRG